MGGSLWSDKHYEEKTAYKVARKIDTFDYSSKISSGSKPAKVHDTLNPAKFKNNRREARDSIAHPNSKPVFIGLDVTGSMQSVPKTIQIKLPFLMGMLVRKGYLEHPSICIGAYGDFKCDKVPIQISQFESGIEIDDHICNLYLEGGGGGNMQESPDLMLYFLAECVDIDSWEKRNEKGYAFIIGDENLPSHVLRKEVKNTFNQDIQSDIPIEEILNKVNEKWELYYIIPNKSFHFKDPSYEKSWIDKLGERVLHLDDPKGISEIIASTIGMLEGNIDKDTVVLDLKEEGVSNSIIKSVSTAMSTIVKKSNISNITKQNSGLSKL